MINHVAKNALGNEGELEKKCDCGEEGAEPFGEFNPLKFDTDNDPRNEVVEGNAEVNEAKKSLFDSPAFKSPKTFLTFSFSSYCLISFARPNSIRKVVGEI